MASNFETVRDLYAALSTMSVGTQKSFVTRERFDEEWKARSGLPV